MADWDWIKKTLGSRALEVAESACLGAFEPQPMSSCYDDELRRARQAIARARGGQLVRFRQFVNRNAFLLACLDYTEDKREEHLVVGYGLRHGSTTKVTSVHRAIGGTHSVQMPAVVAHAMLDHYNRENRNEILIFHNHPYNPLNFLMNSQSLASVADRRQLAALALNPDQLLRTALGLGRVLFYLGENGLVKQFRLPTVLAP